MVTITDQTKVTDNAESQKPTRFSFNETIVLKVRVTNGVKTQSKINK